MIQLVKPIKSVQQLQTDLTHQFRTLGKLFHMLDRESDALTSNARLKAISNSNDDGRLQGLTGVRSCRTVSLRMNIFIYLARRSLGGLTHLG